MKKVLKIKDMTIYIPMMAGEDPEDAEDRLLSAMDSAGAKFGSYNREIETDDSD